MQMPVDPVCGIEMDQELAVSHDHNGKTYYFCCEGCKRIFVKKPKKYSKGPWRVRECPARPAEPAACGHAAAALCAAEFAIPFFFWRREIAPKHCVIVQVLLAPYPDSFH